MPYVSHPSIETPPDSTRIWRYLSVERFISGLHNGLYFTRVDKFRDPLEGTLPPANRMSQDIWLEHHNMGFPVRAQLLEMMEWGTRRCHLVNCWSMSEYENALMWKWYAPNGVAINTTIGRLKEAFRDLTETFYIGKVKYIDYEKDLANLQNNMLTPLFYKNVMYESEKEVRVCVQPRECIDKRGEQGKLVDFPSRGRYYNTKKRIMTRVYAYHDMDNTLFHLLNSQIQDVYKIELTGSPPPPRTGGGWESGKGWGVIRSRLYRYPLEVDPVSYGEMLKYKEWLSNQPPSSNAPSGK